MHRGLVLLTYNLTSWQLATLEKHVTVHVQSEDGQQVVFVPRAQHQQAVEIILQAQTPATLTQYAASLQTERSDS